MTLSMVDERLLIKAQQALAEERNTWRLRRIKYVILAALCGGVGILIGQVW